MLHARTAILYLLCSSFKSPFVVVNFLTAYVFYRCFNNLWLSFVKLLDIILFVVFCFITVNFGTHDLPIFTMNPIGMYICKVTVLLLLFLHLSSQPSLPPLRFGCLTDSQVPDTPSNIYHFSGRQLFLYIRPNCGMSRSTLKRPVFKWSKHGQTCLFQAKIHHWTLWSVSMFRQIQALVSMSIMNFNVNNE